MDLRKFNNDDQFLIHELKDLLQAEFLLTPKQVDQCNNNSSFLPLLHEHPEFVHHEDIMSWVKAIAKQNNISK